MISLLWGTSFFTTGIFPNKRKNQELSCEENDEEDRLEIVLDKVRRNPKRTEPREAILLFFHELSSIYLLKVQSIFETRNPFRSPFA